MGSDPPIRMDILLTFAPCQTHPFLDFWLLLLTHSFPFIIKSPTAKHLASTDHHLPASLVVLSPIHLFCHFFLFYLAPTHTRLPPILIHIASHHLSIDNALFYRRRAANVEERMPSFASLSSYYPPYTVFLLLITLSHSSSFCLRFSRDTVPFRHSLNHHSLLIKACIRFDQSPILSLYFSALRCLCWNFLFAIPSLSNR